MSHGIRNWIPYKLSRNEEEWVLDWLDLGLNKITEPFFDHTIIDRRVQMKAVSPYRSQTSLPFLLEMSEQVESLQPTAFIFHVSRCGSTLLSQSLVQDDAHIVIAEAPLLDEILRANEMAADFSEIELMAFFFSAVKMMGQKRWGSEKHYFIKLDSWHLHFYEQLRKWFPQTPFYFLSREPSAIIASHIKKRGIHAIPEYIELNVFGMKSDPMYFKDFNFYTAKVLEGYYKKIVDIAGSDHPYNHFFDYGWGVKNMLTHFFSCINLSRENIEVAQARLNFHSKTPSEEYQGDHHEHQIPEYEFEKLAYREMIDIIRLKNG